MPLVMVRFPVLLLLAVVSAVQAMPGLAPNQTCRYIPGDKGWPSPNAWGRLNTTVGGRLIATLPVAHVCHQGGAFNGFDAAACRGLAADFMDNVKGAAAICPVPGEMLNPYWQNETCSPFTAPGLPCELGNRAAYSINVTGAGDVRAGIRFALEHNVRLVVRNTGIDYLGQSAGKGALALWTYNLKHTEIIDAYASPLYSGPAVTLGAGMTGGEAYQALNGSGYRMVLPECGLTGVVGGYAQAGGQSQLVTAYGLAADQVLSWEVVTPRGDYLVATPETNTDLYWALSGGGGGTYGVVLSATFKAFPDGIVAGGEMVVQARGGTNDTTALFEAMEFWFSQGPSFVQNSSNNIQFFVTNDTLTILNFVMPDQTASSIDILLGPFLSELHRLGLSYTLRTADYPSYLASFTASYGPLPYGALCPSFPIIASRLVARATVLDRAANKKLVGLVRDITAGGTWWVGCSMLSVQDSVHPPNSVNPAWRAAAAYCNPQTHAPYAWADPAAAAALRRTLVRDILPALEGATPGGGLLSELDPTYEGDWKAGLFGHNYERLLRVKHVYDPDHLMYGLFAVGSDEFVVDGEGRLCVA